MAAAAATARRSAFSTVNDVTPTRQPTVPPGPRPGGLQPAPVTAEELEQWVTVDALQRATGFYPQECKYGGSQLEYSPNPQWERLRVEHQYRAGTPEQMRHGSSTEHAHAYAMGTRSATRNSHVVGSPTMLFHVPPGRPDYGQSSAPAHRVSFPVSRNSSIEEWYIGKFHDR
ncbi:hypothetical protein H4R19_003871 [Coemansia spiralis]|nr:hypothetical protein H4R19_003871 [Coemansia spiralis]